MADIIKNSTHMLNEIDIAQSGASDFAYSLKISIIKYIKDIAEVSLDQDDENLILSYLDHNLKRAEFNKALTTKFVEKIITYLNDISTDLSNAITESVNTNTLNTNLQSQLDTLSSNQAIDKASVTRVITDLTNLSGVPLGDMKNIISNTILTLSGLELMKCSEGNDQNDIVDNIDESNNVLNEELLNTDPVE